MNHTTSNAIHLDKAKYTGERWSIIYGNYEGIERFALQELYGPLQRYLPYLIELMPAEGNTLEQKGPLVLIGTKQSSSLISVLVSEQHLTIPDKPQGYTIACMDSPWSAGRRLVVIAGSDPAGVLYGIEDFNARILTELIAPEKPTVEKRRQALDSMEHFSFSEYPLIEDRGIWSWGYVIYDYRGFLDNMARLRMNILTIWNDCLPLNIAEVIDYAHQRGVKIILGFDWGWGRTDLDVFKPEHQAVIKQEVLHKFKHDYCGIGADGLYFQTLTEHNETHANGESLTKCICRMVNDIASDLFEIEPDLNLQFGLHATSVQENYPDLSELDPRITIMWEDAGVIPYSYMPITDISDNDAAVSPINKEINTPERTLEYSKKLAMFRKDSAFGMVPKGWMVLDWLHEFEHHRPFLLGERDNCFIEDRLRDRQPHWNRVNKLWIKNYGLAAQFYRELLNSQSRLIVTGLIEDGMLERKIQFSVALFSEMMWNPQRTDEALLESAMKPYYGTTT